MGDRKNVKEAVLARFVAEWPVDVPYILPKNPTDSMVGKKEWVRITLIHSEASRQVTIAGQGNRRYERIVHIFAQVMTEINQGDEREDEFAEIFYSMFEGRAFAGITGIITDVSAKEMGLDDDGRYNVLLCEAVFKYRLSK